MLCDTILNDTSQNKEQQPEQGHERTVINASTKARYLKPLIYELMEAIFPAKNPLKR